MDDHNGGYVVYATEQELDEYYETIKLVALIREEFEYHRKAEKHGAENLRKIASILGILGVSKGVINDTTYN